MITSPNGFLLGTAFVLGATASIAQTMPMISFETQDSVQWTEPYVWNLSYVHPSDILEPSQYIPRETTSLEEEVRNDLLLVQEQQKVSHDLFTVLHQTWGIPTLESIAYSEESHIESVQGIIETFGINNPYQSTLGTFTNTDLQVQYQELVDQGTESSLAGLRTAIASLEQDIVNLSEIDSRTDQESLKTLYAALEKGSRNHIRTLESLISRYGETYEPSIIPKEQYIAIISSGVETTNNSK